MNTRTNSEQNLQRKPFEPFTNGTRDLMDKQFAFKKIGNWKEN
jgi:hypothetical protein